MKNLLKKLLFLPLFWLITQTAQAQTKPCQIFGTVFLTEIAQEADFVVFIEEDVTPDLTVYVPANRLYADSPGKWYFVKEKPFADYRIFITDNRHYANFTIAYTEVEEFAGCF